MIQSIEGILPKIKYDTASIIEGGYFYSFLYYFKSNENTNGWDKEPLILSLGAMKNAPNFILGLNLHFVDNPNRFIDILNSFGGAMENDGLNKIVLKTNIIKRIYPPALNAIRIYNKTLIDNCYRINNKFVEEVLKYQMGSFYMSSIRHNQLQNDFKRNAN